MVVQQQGFTEGAEPLQQGTRGRAGIHSKQADQGFPIAGVGAPLMRTMVARYLAASSGGSKVLECSMRRPWTSHSLQCRSTRLQNQHGKNPGHETAATHAQLT
jgi:hypothetical protein